MIIAEHLLLGIFLLNTFALFFLIFGSTSPLPAWRILDLFMSEATADYMVLNPLPHMPILGSSSSAANKDMMSKNMDKWGYSYLIE